MTTIEKIAGYEVHPAASTLPLMEGADFDGMVTSFKECGWLGDAVILLGDVLLDGRNRVRAAQAAGVPVRTRQATPEEAADPVQVVLTNIHRRHLTDDQRSSIAAGLATLRGRKGAQDAQLSTEEAAAMLKVSPDKVRRAKSLKNAAPDLDDKVRSGAMTSREARKEINKRRKPRTKTPSAAATAEDDELLIEVEERDEDGDECDDLVEPIPPSPPAAEDVRAWADRLRAIAGDLRALAKELPDGDMRRTAEEFCRAVEAGLDEKKPQKVAAGNGASRKPASAKAKASLPVRRLRAEPAATPAAAA